jgi:hypothetical protein
MTKEEKRKIRLRISELIEANRVNHPKFHENEAEIFRLGQLLGDENGQKKKRLRKTTAWGKKEIFYLMNHVPMIGFERTAKNLNRTVTSIKGKYTSECLKQQKNSSPGTGREVG